MITDADLVFAEDLCRQAREGDGVARIRLTLLAPKAMPELIAEVRRLRVLCTRDDGED